jgi:hypothetical protein
MERRKREGKKERKRSKEGRKERKKEKEADQKIRRHNGERMKRRIKNRKKRDRFCTCLLGNRKQIMQYFGQDKNVPDEI